ncbi:MAG: M23 family metallopeptidase [Elusimicrobiaceae bacterium]|nr:M23 family metallopeptidase [Elusimicrobiaceae bacterium]
MKSILKQILLRLAIYLPLCLLIVLSMFFYIQRKTAKIHEYNQSQEVYFKKYTGNLKQHISIPLQEAGLSKEETGAIIKKLDSVLNMRRLAPRDKYLLTLDEQDNFKMLVITKDFSRYYVAKEGQDLVAGISDISVQTRTRFAKGKITSSLFASMQEAGLKPGFIVDFTDVFSWSVDFNSDTRAGDKFACYWQEDYTIDGQTLNETILAAYYDGLAVGKTYAFRFEDEFYDENGKFSKKMFLKSPISFRGVRITSRFSYGRMHPILRIRRPHLGIDYAAPVGTPVESVADGVVIFQGKKGGFGNYIEISHPNNYVSCYGHLKSFAKNTHKGARIRQGQTIAYVGSTGLSTGPHLDFRLRQGNKYLDFLNNKNRSSAVREIAPTQREEFNKIKDEYFKILNKE